MIVTSKVFHLQTCNLESTSSLLLLIKLIEAVQAMKSN